MADLTATLNPCHGCGVDVLDILTLDLPARVTHFDVTPAPVDAPEDDLGDYLERHGPNLYELRGSSRRRGWPIHGIHHCTAPNVCVFCRDVHQPGPATAWAVNARARARERALIEGATL